MKLKIPASFFTTLSAHTQGAGETITHTPHAGGAVTTLQASVQSPFDSPLLADGEQEQLLLYIAPETLPVEPVKYDRFFIRGRERAVEDANLITMVDKGAMWIVRVIG